MIIPQDLLLKFEYFYTPHDIDEDRDGLAKLPKGTKFIFNLEEDSEDFNPYMMYLLSDQIEKLPLPHYIAKYSIIILHSHDAYIVSDEGQDLLHDIPVKAFYLPNMPSIEDFKKLDPNLTLGVNVYEIENPSSIEDKIEWMYFETLEDINLDQTFAYEGSLPVTAKGWTIEDVIAYEKSLGDIPEAFKEDDHEQRS